MKKQILVAAGLSVFAMAGAQAQSGACPTGSPRALATQDACQMASDVFGFLAPQLGLALAGGNATIGIGSTLGGIGHFSVGLRANVFSGDLPKITGFPAPASTGAQSRQLQSESHLVGLPTADAAIGIFSGIPLGLTNVGGIDALVSASYVPNVGNAASDVAVKPDQNFQIGYGARIGILQESILVPGVSLTYLKRDLPTTAITGTSTNLDVNITKAKVATDAWRIMVSKSFVLFGVVAGGGQDTYEQSATVQATAKGSTFGTQTSDQIAFTRKLKRTNMFADVSLNLPLFKIVGEVGTATGGNDATASVNTFSSAAGNASRTYGSLGIRFGL